MVRTGIMATLCVAVAGFAIGISGVLVDRMAADIDWQRHTYEVLAAIHEVRFDVASGQSDEVTAGHVERVRRLTADNPVQRRNVGRLLTAQEQGGGPVRAVLHDMLAEENRLLHVRSEVASRTLLRTKRTLVGMHVTGLALLVGLIAAVIGR